MKKSGQFLFETQLHWQQDAKGVLTSKAITEPIKVAKPKVFKGIEGGLWSPEHLFIGSVSSCFMTTYLFYAKQKGLPLSGFECEVIGQVELKNDKLKFTEINVYPKVAVEKASMLDIAKQVNELSKQNCLITKALNVIVYYHPSFEVQEHSVEKKEIHFDKKREVFF